MKAYQSLEGTLLVEAKPSWAQKWENWQGHQKYGRPLELQWCRMQELSEKMSSRATRWRWLEIAKCKQIMAKEENALEIEKFQMNPKTSRVPYL